MIIVLDTTSKSLTAVLAGAVATTQPDFTTHYADATAAAFVEGENDGVLNSTTPVTLVDAPAAGVQRIVRDATIYNADSVNVIVAVALVSAGGTRIIDKVTLVPGATWSLAQIGIGSSAHAQATLGAGSDPALTLLGQQFTLADVLTPTEHTAIGNGAPHHAQSHALDGTDDHTIGGLTSTYLVKSDGSKLVPATNTDTQVSAAVTASHAAVTLDANADAIFGLTAQQFNLDTQAANTVFAGPVSGAAAVPTVRSLEAADIPTLDHGAKLTGLTDDDHTQYLLATGARTGASSQAQTFTSGVIAPTLKPAADSTTALQLQTSGGTAIVTLDTTNQGVNLGLTTAQRVGMYGITSVVQAPALIAPASGAINSGDTTTNAIIGRLISRVQGLESRLANIGAMAVRPVTFLCTCTGAETLTLNSFGVSRSTLVDWGDGNTDTYTGTASRTHAYAGVGTYTVTIADALAITTFDVRDAKVTLNSADIASMINVTTFTSTAILAGRFDSRDVSAWRPTYFYLYSMPSGYAGTFDSADVSAWQPTNFRLYSMPSGYAGTFDSADVSAWRPTNFYLYSMPSGYAGTFDSADVSAWRPTNFSLYSMPSGYAGTFDSADVSAWQPTYFYLYSMPSGYAGTFDSADVSAWRPTTFSLRAMPVATYTITITAGGFAAWATGLNDFQMQNNSLLQAAVEAILWDVYQAAATPRTATGGTINLSGTNAAPSGTYQAATSCPVTVATPGKEIAHELQNDGCAVGFNRWTTVTITA